MEALFNDGETLAIAKGWLEGTHSSSQLRMANAALIIANLARSGEYLCPLVCSRVRTCAHLGLVFGYTQRRVQTTAEPPLNFWGGWGRGCMGSK